jgi:hypothetical protein
MHGCPLEIARCLTLRMSWCYSILHCAGLLNCFLMQWLLSHTHYQCHNIYVPWVRPCHEIDSLLIVNWLFAQIHLVNWFFAQISIINRSCFTFWCSFAHVTLSLIWFWKYAISCSMLLNICFMNLNPFRLIAISSWCAFVLLM